MNLSTTEHPLSNGLGGTTPKTSNGVLSVKI